LAFLEIEGLAFTYENLIMRFDLPVEAGEIVGIVGPSGAGKSTLLSLIGGFEKPIGGTIRVGGVDITQLPPAERPVTTLFQDFNLFPHLNVAENVGLGRNPGLKLDAADQEQVAWFRGAPPGPALRRRTPARGSRAQPHPPSTFAPAG